MKRLWLFCVMLFIMLSSCGLLHFGHKEEKSGCPTTGNNIGAEKILANDPKAMKAAKRASNKGLDKGLRN